MMKLKNQLKFAAAVVCLSGFAACTTVRPYAVTNNSIGEDVGRSTTTLLFGMSAGDQLGVGLYSTNKNFGVIEAARKGNIDTIGCVDVKTSSYLGIVTKVEILVSGSQASGETKKKKTKKKK